MSTCNTLISPSSPVIVMLVVGGGGRAWDRSYSAAAAANPSLLLGTSLELFSS